VVHEVPDTGKLFREIADLLKPNGLLYYTEPPLIVSGRDFVKTSRRLKRQGSGWSRKASSL
jgi:hypothetical protein